MKGNPNPPARELAGALLPSQAYPRQRILVADHDGGFRHVTAKLLKRCGYEVDTAEDGESAWDSLQSNRYHLLITDPNLPKVSGVELLKKLRATRMNLPIIMVTAALPKDEFNRCPLPRPDAMLHKPYRVAQLLVAVRECCARPSFHSSRSVPGQTGQASHQVMVCGNDDSSSKTGLQLPILWLTPITFKVTLVVSPMQRSSS